MRLTAQRRIASDILGCSPSKIRFDSSRHEDIKEAITKRDIRGLIKEGAIARRTVPQQSKARARKLQSQKRKSQRKGAGSRKGTITARVSKKERWMIRVRAQRKLLRELREGEAITRTTYSDLYRKSGGGFFRSRRHINLYIDEHSLRQKAAAAATPAKKKAAAAGSRTTKKAPATGATSAGAGAKRP